MKAIVEHYAKGEFQVDRPEVAISEKFLKLNIESGTLYEGVFTVNSTNDHVIIEPRPSYELGYQDSNLENAGVRVQCLTIWR